jgi:hypothetical protein
MSFTVSATDVRGVSTANRKTPELALRKARDLMKRGCYDLAARAPSIARRWNEAAAATTV